MLYGKASLISRLLPLFKTALAIVLIENHLIEGITEDFRLLAKIAIASVTRAADDDQPAVGGHAADGLDKGVDGIRIVSVIRDERGTAVVENVETAWRGLGIADKGGHATTTNVPRNSETPTCGHGDHCVFDLEPDATIVSDRNFVQGDLVAEFPFGGDNVAIFDENPAFPLGEVICKDAFMAVHCEVSDRTRS